MILKTTDAIIVARVYEMNDIKKLDGWLEAVTFVKREAVNSLENVCL